MTREDAIKVLNMVEAHGLADEAKRMAIKALEHPEQNVIAVVPCGDAISRQAVLDAIEDDNRNGHYSCFASNNDAQCFKGVIGELPSVNPQPKTGHWEYVQYDYNPKLGNWHCSECRCIVIECVNKEEKGGIPLYKYCPQCGTKMVEPQESEGKDGNI